MNITNNCSALVIRDIDISYISSALVIRDIDAVTKITYTQTNAVGG